MFVDLQLGMESLRYLCSKVSVVTVIYEELPVAHHPNMSYTDTCINIWLQGSYRFAKDWQRSEGLAYIERG